MERGALGTAVGECRAIRGCQSAHLNLALLQLPLISDHLCQTRAATNELAEWIVFFSNLLIKRKTDCKPGTPRPACQAKSMTARQWTK
eukprot:282995-Amphidinium_carterae.1